MRIKVLLIDYAERIGATFVIAFLTATLPAGGQQDTVLVALGIGGLAAFASFLSTTLIWLVGMKGINNPYLDLAYRSVLTFGQTLLAQVVAAGAVSALSFEWNHALRIALIAAGASLFKGLIGLNNPATLGASSLLLRPHETELPKRSQLPLVA